MKQLFENYGAVALGILALLVLIAMITPVGNIIKTSLQGTVQTFSTSIESQNNAIDFVTIDSGTRIKIGDKHYIVLEKMGLTQFKLLETSTFKGVYWSWSSADNEYQNNTMDEYLNNEYLSSLPVEIQNAIVESDIKCTEYHITANTTNYYGVMENGEITLYYNNGTQENPNYIPFSQHKKQHGIKGFVPLEAISETSSYNIQRKIFLPSVDELSKIMNLSDEKDVYDFASEYLNSPDYMWLRDISPNGAITSGKRVIGLSGGDGSVTTFYPHLNHLHAMPTYTLDLSKINFEIE